MNASTRLHMMASSLLALLISVFVLSGCHIDKPTPHHTGSAILGVSTQALTTNNIASVTVQVSGTGIKPTIKEALVQTGQKWQGVIGHIPVGPERTFVAIAYDAKGNPIFEGKATKVSIEKGKTAAVFILLQQIKPPTPFQNTTPTIQSLTATSHQVGFDEDVQLEVQASDADGDKLSIQWYATGGSLSNQHQAKSTWRSPAKTPAPYNINVIVSDGKGGRTGASLTILVRPSFANGDASVQLSFNTFPEIQQVTSTKGRLDASESTTLSVATTDADGDALTFLWSDGGGDCQGSFSSNTKATTSWKAPTSLPKKGRCTLKVSVSDGNGGTNTGQVTIQLATPPKTLVSPKITSTYQSSQSADTGDKLVFRITANDPLGGSLSFAWKSAQGNINNNVTNTGSGPYTSQLIWPMGSGNQTISVTVTSSNGAPPTTHSFTIQSSTTPPPPQGSAYTSTSNPGGFKGWIFGRDIASDSSGHRYVIGYFLGTPAFGNTIFANTGQFSLYVAKIDSSGTWLWAKQVTSPASVYGRGIVIDANGDLVITGSFDGSASFGNTTLTSIGKTDAFLAKLSTSGVWLWASRVGGGNNDYGTSLAADSSGNVYVFGVSSGASSFGNHSLSGTGNTFVAKCDSSGNWQWARRMGNANLNVQLGKHGGVAVNSSGVYVTSNFSGSLTLGTSTLTATGHDILLAKIDASGNWLWAKGVGGSSAGVGTGVSLDGQGGVYVTGSFVSSASFGSSSITTAPGKMGVFVAKADANGSWLWASSAPSQTNQLIHVAIATTSTGHSHIAGGTRSTLAFGSHSVTVANTSADDAFVATVDDSGAWTDAISASSPGVDAAAAITLGGCDKRFLTGHFYNGATFASTTLSTTNYTDVFVWDAPANTCNNHKTVYALMKHAGTSASTCVIMNDMSTKCWGYGVRGQLGYGNANNLNSPPASGVNLGPGRTATQISPGWYHTCAILDDGSVKCWGWNLYGALGNGGGQGLNSPPSNPINLGAGRTAVQISVGYLTTCAVLDNGALRCWGSNGFGEIGLGMTSVGQYTPGNAVFLGNGRTAKQVTLGHDHACAILDDGSVKCWGWNGNGALGDGTYTNRTSPSTRVNLGAGRTAVEIRAGRHFTCAILDDGSIRCWGNNGNGTLGDGTKANRNTSGSPIAIGAGRTATQISVSWNHACALLDDGSVKCWGWNYYGTLGDGTNTDRNTPVSVANFGAGRSVKQIAVARNFSCALLDNDSVKCWGYNGLGALGLGHLNHQNTPPATPISF